VFFGGGTPSRLPPRALGEIVAALDPVPGAEITAEVNPEDLDEAWVEGALTAGIDRVSLGVQSFDPAIAGRLGRAHTRKAADRALELARAFRSRSVDLIFAVPGQAVDQLDADLDRVLAAEVPHVSIYGLTFEPGTRFERARARGRLAPVEDEAWRVMYDRLVDRLDRAGVRRYEVSNFARDGHRSAHNRLYWTDAPYLGLGPSAHGYAPDGARWVNHDLDRYLVEADPTASSERPDPEARATDLVVSALRSVEGLDRARLASTTGLQVERGVVRSLVAAGLVREDGARLALTDAGFPLCDAVAARLVDGLEESPQ
jgi:oxygen-independent coproporphyrinogen-3 oxidase